MPHDGRLPIGFSAHAGLDWPRTGAPFVKYQTAVDGIPAALFEGPVPERFHLLVRKGEPNAMSNEPCWSAWLNYAHRADEVRLVALVVSRDTDVASCLTQLRKGMTLANWATYAVTAAVDLREGLRAFSEAFQIDLESGQPLGSETDIGLAWTQMQQMHAERLDAALEAARAAPVRRRKNRLTQEHFVDVAAAYREAVAGGAPTAAVADTFSASHSTAAKWVQECRRRGLLPATVKGSSGLKEGS